MGDFNAKVGSDHVSAGGAIGKFAVEDTNLPGERLIQFANANRSLVTNTRFQQSKSNRQWTYGSRWTGTTAI